MKRWTPDMFIDALTRFKDTHGEAYGEAIDNIRRDLHGDDNPHGNIGREAQDSLNKACAGGAVDLVAVIAAHQSHQPAAAARPRPVPAEPLRRVVPYSWFLSFHIGAASERTLNLQPGTKRKTAEIPHASFTGTTGQVGGPSWWTWGSPPPEHGRDYVEELALPQTTKEAAMKGGVVEISIPRDRFPTDLFKPSALDGFMARTRFEPDLTDTPHGLTQPENTTTHSRRPELVSRSFAYGELDDKIEIISVVRIDY